MFFVCLAGELSTVNSVLSTWVQLDAFFNMSSTPTDGLVGLLSNASSGDDRLIDEYLCVNATVKKGPKVKYGFQFLGNESKAIRLVSRWAHSKHHDIVKQNFALVASLGIQQLRKDGSMPLITANLWDGENEHTMGPLYTADNMWDTVYEGTTKESRAWEPKQEYQVALMLHDNKALCTLMASHCGRRSAVNR
ncbi:hypothetical protein TcYC6_0099100 [Trypanosoma cruzi]|nr:hypothetical protein TcYC6_0099100 [Trypanosoma cruzi]